MNKSRIIRVLANSACQGQKNVRMCHLVGTCSIHPDKILSERKTNCAFASTVCECSVSMCLSILSHILQRTPYANRLVSQCCTHAPNCPGKYNRTDNLQICCILEYLGKKNVNRHATFAIYSRTSIARTSMARLPWLIRSRF